jgi:hypothetical protein
MERNDFARKDKELHGMAWKGKEMNGKARQGMA